jgi:hypothetical protein
MTNRTIAILSVLFCTSLSLTGCANMDSAAAANPVTQGGNFSGTVHGGRQPVANATVILWAAGNTGYGSTAQELVQTTSDANGLFSFGPTSGHTYTCPDSASTTVSESIYITATGGQPTTGITNSAAAFLVGLGDCPTVQTDNPNVTLNEVTTVATMYALQQFFSITTAPTPLPGTTIVGLGSIGASSSNLTGMRNAFFTVNNLVNIASGQSVVTNVSAAVSGYTTNPVVTVTPDITKINTLADIIAACMNTAGATSTACHTLFADVASTGAVDTVQAAYDLAVNPTSTVSGTSNVSAIYNNSVPQSPFGPSLSGAPADWTVGVTYGSNSFKTIAATTSPAAPAGTAYLLTNPEWIGIDTQGNVWVSNNATSSSATPGNSATELSGVGIPEVQIFTAAGNIANPSGLALDPANDVYVSSYGASGAGQQIVEYTNLSVVKTFLLSAPGPAAIASDGAGNIYIADFGAGSTAGSGDLEVIPVASSNGTTASPQATGISVGPNSSLAIDANNTLWLSNNASTATIQLICSANPCAATSTTVASNPQSIAIDHSGNVWVGNISTSTTSGSLAEIAETSTTTITAVSGSPFSGGGLANPFRGIVDGNGNVWETNFVTGGGTVSEMSNTGTPISPSAGFAHTFSGASGLAIDRSGDVWIGNSGATASPTAQGYITEIVGQAVPVFTPLSAGLPATSGGANKIGIRP